MAQATTTGRGGVQIELHVHGQQLDPLNIEPAKDLWAALGRAINEAERNVEDLRANDVVPEDVPAETHESVPDATLPPGVATVGDAGAEDVAVDPEDVVVTAPDVLPEGVVTMADVPAVADESGPTDFHAMTKPELVAFLDASGVEHKASASKADLVKLARKVKS